MLSANVISSAYSNVHGIGVIFCVMVSRTCYIVVAKMQILNKRLFEPVNHLIRPLQSAEST